MRTSITTHTSTADTFNGYTITEKKKLSSNTYEISFKAKNTKFQFSAGQYIHITLQKLLYPDPHGNGRDFSLVSSPHEDTLTITFKESPSGFKKTLLEKQNAKIEIDGPFGDFILPKEKTGKLIFIAGGIGITPFMSMLRFINQENYSYTITLIYLNKSESCSIYLHELQTIAQGNNHFKLVLLTGRLSLENLHHYVDNTNLNYLNFYIAGPPSMVMNTYSLLKKIGVQQQNIKLEEFPGYDGEISLINEKQLKNIWNEEAIHQIPIRNKLIEKLGEGLEGELAQRSLSDLEALLQALSNSALVSETNAEGTITFANDKFVEISKYPREELIGHNHRILKSGYHSQAFYVNLWSTITRGKQWRGLLKNKAKDGSYYWVDTSIAPILGNDGKPAKYISVRFPITERKQAEEELQERAKQQNVLTVLSQEALISSDFSSLFTTTVTLLAQTLNVEYCAVLKLFPNGQKLYYEAGTGFTHIIKGETFIPVKNLDSLGGYILASKEPVIIENLSTEHRFNGSEFLHDHNVVSGICLTIHGQEYPFGILLLCTSKLRVFSTSDISFIQAVANLLANAARNQLDKRKDEFLGMASHELKTPITSIKTYTQLLQKITDNQKNDQTQLFLSRIEHQLNRVSDLINDLLDISRINAGKIDYTYESFNFNDIIEEVIFELQLISKKHKIILENSVTHKIFGDKHRLSQVLSNLVSNAIKYSPDAKAIIINSIEDKDKFIISVKDFGVGIPTEEQTHIFERFYQGNGSKRKDFPGGLGLGLFISNEIIKRHKGHIWVESEVGKGSKFSFSLPLKQLN